MLQKIIRISCCIFSLYLFFNSTKEIKITKMITLIRSHTSSLRSRSPFREGHAEIEWNY